MQKLLVLSINLVFLVFSSFILGCTTTRETYDFQPKTYDEYYNAIENSTIQFELIIADKRAVCYYTNDSITFVYTIKHQYSNEYGYIYNTSLNELYCMENQVITEKKIKNEHIIGF